MGLSDNSANIMAALNSGSMVVWDKDKTYNVTSFITVNKTAWKTNKGVINLNTSRYSLGKVSLDFSDRVRDTDPIRGLYVESAYDLCELMFIKGMGINTMLHYGNFNVSHDTAGTVDNVYDAAELLGMRVIANTEVRDVHNPGLGLADFISKYDNHPAIYAWACRDEAMSRKFSVADQKDWADTIRGRSVKPVTIVDAWLDLDPITPALYDEYDIVFVDPYPQNQDASLDLGVRVERDLTRIRRAYALMKAHSKTDRIIPVLGASTPKAHDPAWPGSRDIDQVVAVGERYSFSGNGEFVAFVWDGKGDPVNDQGVRSTPKFQTMIRNVCKRVYHRPTEMEVFLVGGNSNTGHYPLYPLIARMSRADPTTVGDVWQQSKAFPVHCISGTGTQTDRNITTEAGWNQSGLGFKGNSATFCTDIPFRKYVAMHGFINTQLGSVSGSMSIAGSYDGGYAVIPRASQSIADSKYEWVAVEGSTPNPTDSVCIVNTCTIDSGFMRRWFQGIILSSSW